MDKAFSRFFSFAFIAFLFCAGAIAESSFDTGSGLGYRIRFAGSYKERENALLFSPITNEDIANLSDSPDAAKKSDAFAFTLPTKPLKIKITDTTDALSNQSEAEQSPEK